MKFQLNLFQNWQLQLDSKYEIIRKTRYGNEGKKCENREEGEKII